MRVAIRKRRIDSKDAVRRLLYVERMSLAAHDICRGEKETAEEMKAMLNKILWVLLGVIPLLSCSEHLPSYSDPSQILKGTFDCRYILSATENAVHLNLVVTNSFDETLQGEAVLKGSGMITLKRNAALRRSFSLSSVNLVHGRYDNTTGILTLDPGESVTLRFVWNFAVDTGGDLTGSQFVYYPDSTCPQRLIAYEETFLLEGHVQVFDRIPTIDFRPIEFSMCHVKTYVPPGATCLSFDTSKPCSR